MTKQLVHNVQPGQRQFVTQSGQPARSAASNGRHPPAIDSRHLAAPGVPLATANAMSGPEFERQARALMGQIEVYANQIAASGTAGPGVTAEDLKCLPLARLQQLALRRPTKPVQGNAHTRARYGLNDPVGVQGNRGGASDPYAGYPDNPGADEFKGYDLNDPMGTGSGRKS